MAVGLLVSLLLLPALPSKRNHCSSVHWCSLKILWSDTHNRCGYICRPMQMSLSNACLSSIVVAVKLPFPLYCNVTPAHGFQSVFMSYRSCPSHTWDSDHLPFLLDDTAYGTATPPVRLFPWRTRLGVAAELAILSIFFKCSFPWNSPPNCRRSILSIFVNDYIIRIRTRTLSCFT